MVHIQIYIYYVKRIAVDQVQHIMAEVADVAEDVAEDVQCSRGAGKCREWKRSVCTDSAVVLLQQTGEKQGLYV